MANAQCYLLSRAITCCHLLSRVQVLDPMLLDVLGIEDSHKEAATPAGDATGLSSPVSGSFLQHSFGSQAELSSQQLEECRGSGDMKRL